MHKSYSVVGSEFRGNFVNAFKGAVKVILPKDFWSAWGRLLRKVETSLIQAKGAMTVFVLIKLTHSAGV
jgi:hypothetical protein